MTAVERPTFDDIPMSVGQQIKEAREMGSLLQLMDGQNLTHEEYARAQLYAFKSSQSGQHKRQASNQKSDWDGAVTRIMLERLGIKWDTEGLDRDYSRQAQPPVK